MLYIGFVFILITTLLYFAVNHLQFLYVVRFLHGAALGVASTATGTIVAKIIPNERHGEGIGYHALSITLAAAVDQSLGMFIDQHADFNMHFVLCTVLLAFSFVCSLLLNVPKPELTKEQLPGMKGFKLRNFFESKAFPISVI